MDHPLVKRAVQPVLLAVLLVALGPAAARAAPYLYATNDVDGTVSVVDTATRAVVATAAVGTEPVALSAASDRGRVFVGLRGAPVLAAIDTASHTATGRAPSDLVGTVDDVAVHPSGARLYAVALGSCESVTVVDVLTDTAVRRLQAGRAAIRAVVNAAGIRAWVGGTPGITVIDAIRNVALTRIPLPLVYAMALHPEGTRLYAASTTDEVVLVIDTTSSAQVARIPMPGIALADIAIAPDGSQVYLLGSDRVIALATPTDGPVTVTLTARGPDGSVLPAGANPRTVTLPAGGALHEPASELFARSSGETTVGTVEITSPSLGLRGTSLLEQPGTGLAAGLPVHGQRVTEAVVPEQPGTNYLSLYNPGPAALAVTLRRFDVAGTVVGEAGFVLPPRGLALRTASDLFGVLPASRLARIEITGPGRFVAHNVVVEGGQAAAFAGQGRAGLAATLYAPLVAELPGVAATSLTLLNPSRLVPLRVGLTLQDGAG